MAKLELQIINCKLNKQIALYRAICLSLIMKKFSFISTCLLGVIFLISAFAKAWDAETFADMLLKYGPQWFSIGAPIIILLETILGIALLLRISPKWSAICADGFLIVVSAIFAYGVLVKGIEDCGCFGIFSNLFTSKPWMTFVRNALFICISIPAILYSPKTIQGSWLKAIAIIFIVGLSCFICGLSMGKSYKLPKISSVKVTYSRNMMMEQLKDIYPFQSDSSYVVYLFSFTCPHCQNSFANVQQFQQFNVVDKVIGISIQNEEAMERFYRIYNPEIEIFTISKMDMHRITNQLPVGIFIKENSIVKTETGRITSPGLFID